MIRLRFLIAGLLLLAGIGVAPSAEAGDIEVESTVFATDVVSAGVGGLRDSGTGTITVAGVSGTVTKALLYWHGPTNVADPTANALVTFDSTDVTGTNIGVAADNNWGFLNSQAYRADVTALVSGNGTYSIDGLYDSDALINVNGASLLVFFDDGDPTNDRDVVLFDGNDSTIFSADDDAGWNASLTGIEYDGGDASIELHVSDGQAVFPEGDVSINGTAVVPPVLFDGTTVPNVGLGEALWDIRTIDLDGFLTVGTNDLLLTTPDGADALSLVVAAVNLPAGSAPNQPPSITCTPDPIEVGALLTCEVRGFKPFTEVTIEINPVLGVGVTDANGDVTISGVVPADTPLGLLTVTASGIGPDNNPIVLALAGNITVVAAGPTTTEPTQVAVTDPTVAPTTPGSQSPATLAPTTPGTTPLPATGSGTLLTAIAGIALVLAGSMTLRARRRFLHSE